jgi:cell division protein ZapA (FtsZ GTPase activity inhibitor)
MATFEITVWGEKMRVTSDEEQAFISRVADYLNEKMQMVKAGDPSELSTKIVSLRTAYLIAAEMLKMQAEMGKLDFTLEEIDKVFAKLQK